MIPNRSPNSFETVNRSILERCAQEFRMSDGASSLHSGSCPSCAQPTLWVPKDHPVTLRCNRLNSCGYEERTLDKWPELRELLRPSYRVSPEETARNPHALADAYLVSRGLAQFVGSGLYDQSRHKGDDGALYPAIRFKLTNGATWSRMMGVESGKKAHFSGSYQGEVWGAESVSPDKEIWVSEGILDALSLRLSGKQAVSAMSSGHVPEKWLERLPKGTRLVVAFDNDPPNPKGKRAGVDGGLRLVRAARSLGLACRVAIPPEGKDWNDLLRENRLESEFPEALWRGDLELAESAEEYGEILRRRVSGSSLIFNFQNKLWRQNQDEEHATPIANRSVEYLYSITDPLQNGVFYVFRAKGGGRDDVVTLSGADLANASAFQTALLCASPNADFSGVASDMSRLRKTWFSGKTNHVRSIPWTGYDRESGAFVCQEWGFDSAGRELKRNHLDCWNLDKDHWLKAVGEIRLSIAPKAQAEILRDFYRFYGLEGIACLGYWAASLLSCQIRQEFGSFPFLSVCGEPGSGKSALAQFLWKLIGRENHEGTPMNAQTTANKVARDLAKVSNIPSVLLEKNQGQSRFDFESLLPGYDGHSISGRANKSHGLDTRELPFQTSIVFVQNFRLTGSEALRSRAIEFYFPSRPHSEELARASQNLRDIPVKQAAWLTRFVLSAPKTRLETFRESYHSASRTLSSSVTAPRVMHNFAILLASVEMIGEIIPEWETIRPAFLAAWQEWAKNRESALREDSPLVELFWERLLDFIENEGLNNYSVRPGEIAVSLREYEQTSGELKLQSLPSMELREQLRTSRRFMGESQVVKNSLTGGKSKRCWIFKDK